VNERYPMLGTVCVAPAGVIVPCDPCVSVIVHVLPVAKVGVTVQLLDVMGPVVKVLPTRVPAPPQPIPPVTDTSEM